MKPPRLVSTPVGASALSAALVTIVMSLLSLWPVWARVPSATQAAVQTVLTAVAVYLGGWVAVVRAPGQQVALELTASPLPTVQNAAAVKPAGAGQSPVD
jgi:hypothetical protein